MQNTKALILLPIVIMQERSPCEVFIRIGALATLSRNFHIESLRPILGWPDVEVILRSGASANLLQSLEALFLDAVLVNRAPFRYAATPFVLHLLWEQPVSLVGTPELLNGISGLSNLLASLLAILPTTGTGVRIGFEALAERLGLRPQIAAEVENMAMIRLLAREGVAQAVLSPIVVQDELNTGRLVEADRLPSIDETFDAVTPS